MNGQGHRPEISTTTLKRAISTLCFQLYDILEKEKLWRHKRITDGQGLGGGEKGRAQGEFLGQRHYLV